METVIDSSGCNEIGELTKEDINLDIERRKFIIRNRLRNSAGTKRLGVFWLILDPVAISMVYLFVLTVVRSHPNFESLFIGVSMYRIFNVSFMSGVRSIKDFSGGIVCERIRSNVLINASLRYRIIETLLQSSGISCILYFYLKVSIIGMFCFILISLLMGILAEGVGFNLSKVIRRIPDFDNLIRYFLLLMFFGSPVLYSMSFTTGLHYTINGYNPFTYFVELVRHTSGVESVFFDLSSNVMFFMMTLTSLLALRGFYQIDKLRWEVSSWS